MMYKSQFNKNLPLWLVLWFMVTNGNLLLKKNNIMNVENSPHKNMKQHNCDTFFRILRSIEISKEQQLLVFF